MYVTSNYIDPCVSCMCLSVFVVSNQCNNKSHVIRVKPAINSTPCFLEHTTRCSYSCSTKAQVQVNNNNQAKYRVSSGVVTHLSKETRQQKERGRGGEEGWTKFKKGGKHFRWTLHKLETLGILCEVRELTCCELMATCSKKVSLKIFTS